MQNSHNGLYDDVTGAILAGGPEPRTGEDPAGLAIAGEPPLARAERVMRMLFDRLCIVGARPDRAGSDLPCYRVRYPGHALAGLHTALGQATTDWVCVLPDDLPYPSVGLLRSLLAARQNVAAVVAGQPEREPPLVGCFHRECLPLIEKRLPAAEYGLSELIDELPVCTLGPAELPPGWRRALYSINRPEDLAKLTRPTPAVTVVARSGTGKTTLLEKLIHELTLRGWTIGALKHDAHRFEIDHEGKDSWRLTRAGAAVTTISSSEQTATIQRHEMAPGIREILERDFRDIDLVLTEGFKQSDLPKIEIHRHALGHPLLCRGESADPNLIAVASDSGHDLDVPVFDLNAAGAIATYLERTFLA